MERAPRSFSMGMITSTAVVSMSMSVSTFMFFPAGDDRIMLTSRRAASPGVRPWMVVGLPGCPAMPSLR